MRHQGEEAHILEEYYAAMSDEELLEESLFVARLFSNVSITRAIIFEERKRRTPFVGEDALVLPFRDVL